MINDSGKLPRMETTYWKGEKVYVRRITPKHFMRMFQGPGISEIELKTLRPYMRILFLYRGEGPQNYLATVRQFLDSEKVYVNSQRDVQRFVSFRDMQKL